MATPERKGKTREGFTRAAKAGKEKTDFWTAIKINPAKEKAIARAIAVLYIRAVLGST